MTHQENCTCFASLAGEPSLSRPFPAVSSDRLEACGLQCRILPQFRPATASYWASVSPNTEPPACCCRLSSCRPKPPPSACCIAEARPFFLIPLCPSAFRRAGTRSKWRRTKPTGQTAANSAARLTKRRGGTTLLGEAIESRSVLYGPAIALPTLLGRSGFVVLVASKVAKLTGLGSWVQRRTAVLEQVSCAAALTCSRSLLTCQDGTRADPCQTTPHPSAALGFFSAVIR